jgi:hypothetical protein
MLFTIFSTDLSHFILNTWLGKENTRSLVNLDVAVCNILLRQQYVCIIRGCEVSYNGFLLHPPDLENRFLSFLEWAKERDVSTRSIATEVDGCLLSSCSFFLRRVEEITLSLEHDQTLDVGNLLRSFPNLRSVDISGSIMRFTAVEKEKQSLCKNLENLSLLDCTAPIYILRPFLVTIGLYSKGLKRIELAVEDGCGCDILLLILKYCTGLEELHFTDCPSEYQELKSVSARFDELFSDEQRLSFTEHSFITIRKLTFLGYERMLLPILSKCPNLVELSAYMYDEIYSDSFVTIFTTMLPKLNKLHILHDMNMEIEDMLSLLRLNSLETLSLENLIGSIEVHAIASRFTSLRRLSIVCSADTNLLPLCYGTMIHLESLWIEYDAWSSSFNTFIHKHKHITFITQIKY